MLITEILDVDPRQFLKKVSNIYDQNFKNIEKITKEMKKLKDKKDKNRRYRIIEDMNYLENKKKSFLIIEDNLNKLSKEFKRACNLRYGRA